jgi:hypothetical protein
MPIPNYAGETFVAFMDISGFKAMMRNPQTAVRAMDKFYSAGYSILGRNHSVHGLFVSDCAVLFVPYNISANDKLEHILTVTEQINRELVQHEIMLMTSITYGQFRYSQRLEFPGIEKHPIYGNAYVAAFLDNESGQPRIQPGQCRIGKRNLPPDTGIRNNNRIEESEKHWYYYWMLNDQSLRQAFKDLYNDAYQQKYRGMLEAINRATNNRL